MVDNQIGTTRLVTLVLVAALGLTSVTAGAQIPSWTRFAPEDAADRMDDAAADLEDAIRGFREARNVAFRELFEMPAVDTSAILADVAPPTGDREPPDGTESDGEGDRREPTSEIEIGEPPSDDGLVASHSRAVSERWQQVRDEYAELKELILSHRPGGGTVSYSAVERYLLGVQDRLGSDIGELHDVRDEVSAYLTSLRDRETIETYLTALSDQETEGATQTHLRFLLQEAMAEWWLEILFGLEPEHWLPPLRRQLTAVGDGDPEVRDDIERVIELLVVRGEQYEAIASTPDDLPSRVHVEALLSDRFEAGTTDGEALSVILRALGVLGFGGSVTPFERDPRFRVTVARFSTVVSMLSTGQRVALAEGLALPSLLPARAVAAGLAERRIDAAGLEDARAVVELADEAFSGSELAGRAEDVHASYVADGEAAVERLSSYLADEEARTDEQMQWSTLAVLENRYAQRLVSGDSSPRARDYLDSFVRRINERVDEGLADSLHADLVSAVSSGGLEADAPVDSERLAAILPASARRGRITVGVRPMSPPASTLRYDRTVAVRIQSEADTGSTEVFAPHEVARRYYAASFHAQTRSRGSVEPDVAARWMYTHGHSTVPAITAGGNPFEDEWIAGVEELLLAAALPWLDASEQAVDFVQESDFRARAYARLLTVYNAVVVPSLRTSRPAIELDPTVRTVVSILTAIAEADVSTQKGEARIAGLLRVTPPDRVGFSAPTLVGAIVGLFSDQLSTNARQIGSVFRYARVAELDRVIESADVGERGVALLRRVETYADRGWIAPGDAVALRRNVVARLTDREETWVEQ